MEKKLNYYFNYDIYARSPNFYLNNHDKVSTCFGIILTLVYIIVSLTLLIFQLISIVARKNLKVYDSTIYGGEMPIIDLNADTLYFAFGLEDPQTSTRFIDNSIYIPKIVFVDKAKVNDELVTVYQKTMEFEKCNVNNFGEDYQHLFLENELNNSYCLKKFDYNLTLAGGYKYERFSYIRIRIYPCVNSSENNNSCKSQEEIDRYMSSGYFSIIFKDIGLNPSNYSFPVLPTLQDLFTTIDKRIYKNYILNLGVTEIHTDTGLLNEKMKVQKYLQFRKELQTFTFRDEEEYYSGKSVILVQIKLDDTIVIQTRYYTKIAEVLSTIGGYMQLMNTVFLILSIIANRFSLELEILNNIFKFNVKKKRIIMKCRKLNDFDFLNRNDSLSPIYKIKKINNSVRPIEFDNKSKNSLILKDNDNNNLSFLNISENKHGSEKKCKTILKNNHPNNAIAFENSKNEISQSIISKKPRPITQENSKENGTNLNSKLNIDLGYKDFKDRININIFDYCSCYLISEKHQRYIELYNISNSFYRKKLDVVNVFNILLLIEKVLLKNNYEYVYSFKEEIENSNKKE